MVGREDPGQDALQDYCGRAVMCGVATSFNAIGWIEFTTPLYDVGPPPPSLPLSLPLSLRPSIMILRFHVLDNDAEVPDVVIAYPNL